MCFDVFLLFLLSLFVLWSGLGVGDGLVLTVGGCSVVVGWGLW